MITRFGSRVVLLAAVLMPSAGRASTLDELIAQLGGSNDVARVRARQLLPRQDILAAAPRVVALVREPNPAVSTAAFNVLMDFTAAVSMPGREEERAGLTREIMALIAPGESAAIKDRGLRLLALSTPAGMELSPIAAILADQDAVLAEKARAALQEIGTPQARKILRDHLPKAQPSFQCAILSALTALKDRESLAAVAALCQSDDARVRAAAAQALAWTGDPFRLTTMKQVIAAADDATRGEAQDALLRLLNAIEARGGNWEIVVAGYQELSRTEAGALKDGALAGLGRIGDGSCVEPVLAAIKAVSAPTRLVGLAALRDMQGVDVTRALVAAYPAQPKDLQAALLPTLGGRHHELTLPILLEAARSNDAAIRPAGIQALADSGLVQALPPLLEISKSGSPAEKAAATGGILKMGNSLRFNGKTREAGQAYAAALELATEDTDRRAILEGLTACPAAEALPAIEKLSDRKELAQPTARALIATARALTAAQRKPDAVAALERARTLDSSPDTARLILAGLRDAGAAADYAAMLGLITRWWTVGPFELGAKNEGWETAYINEPEVNLTAKYMSGKRRVEWVPAKAPDDRGVIDLHKSISNGDGLIGYAYTEITVDKDTDAQLLLGVDDSERVWVNGQKVYEKFVPRAMTPDEDVIPIHLKAGVNSVLLKIWQQTLGWEFCARLTAPDGKPITFTQKSK